MQLLKNHRIWLAVFIPLMILALVVSACAPKAIPAEGPPRSPQPYTIHPMLNGVVAEFPLEMFTYHHYFFEVIPLPYGNFYIEGVPGHHVVVDTGASETTFDKLGFAADDEASTEELLAEHGLTPADIDTVILTHMHFDHVENLKLYKNAKVIVQKAELEASTDPPVAQAVFYIPELWEGVDFEVVEGDVELFPGIWLIFSPGHAVGGQSVLVDTLGGRYIIMGLCACDLNIEEEIGPGIHTDADLAYHSMMKIKNMADTVITLHDMSSFERTFK